MMPFSCFLNVIQLALKQDSALLSTFSFMFLSLVYLTMSRHECSFTLRCKSLSKNTTRWMAQKNPKKILELITYLFDK